MGSKNSRAKTDKNNNNDNKKETSVNTWLLTEKEYEYIVSHTGMQNEELKILFERFMKTNPEGRLNEENFVELYKSLRNEENLDKVSRSVFRAFDADKNGYVTFNEFMIAYALTSRGDVRTKLEYAFNLYDTDGNGYLDNNEITAVLNGMLELLSIDEEPSVVASICIDELDTDNDGRVSKQEFIDGLMKTYSLRTIMSPFN